MHEKENNKSRKQIEIRDYIKAVAVFIVSVAIALVIFFEADSDGQCLQAE